MKISILTPSYNSANYLRRAIESVLSQDYPCFEHIVADGGSTDESLSILNEYPFIQFISEKDNGQSDAMNKAFRMSTGDIIVYLNADDYFYPGAFSAVISAFRKHPESKVVIGDLDFIFNGTTSKRTPSTDLSAILKFWDYSFPLNPVSYFYKREVQESIGPFPVENHYTMDYWFLLRIYKKFKLIKIQETLGVFYLNEGSKSNNTDTLNNLKKMAFSYLFDQKDYLALAILYIRYKNFSIKNQRKV